MPKPQSGTESGCTPIWSLLLLRAICSYLPLSSEAYVGIIPRQPRAPSSPDAGQIHLPQNDLLRDLALLLLHQPLQNLLEGPAVVAGFVKAFVIHRHRRADVMLNGDNQIILNGDVTGARHVGRVEVVVPLDRQDARGHGPQPDPVEIVRPRLKMPVLQPRLRPARILQLD